MRSLNRSHQLSSSTAAQFILVASSSLHQQTAPISNAERSFFKQPRSFSTRRKQRNPLDTRTVPSQRNIAIPNALGGESNASTDSSSQNASLNEQNFALKTAFEQQSAIGRLDRQERSANLLWDGIVVKDATNPTIQELNKIRTNSRYRDNQGRFLQTGKNFMEEMARDYKMHPKHLLVREDKDVPNWAENNRSRGRTEVIKVDFKVMNSLYPGNDGFVGDFEMPDAPLKEELMVNRKKFRSVLVLDNINDAGQLGSMIRSAAAFAYDAIFLVNQCADLYDSDTLKSARGVHFQELTPIYVLKSENGDDVSGMLNHVMLRNDLEPILLTANKPDYSSIAATAEPCTVSTPQIQKMEEERNEKLLSPIAKAAAATAAKKKTLDHAEENKQEQEKSLDVIPEDLKKRVKTLHQLCMESYCPPPTRSTTTTTTTTESTKSEETKPFDARRHMLCVSSDHFSNFEQRMRQTLAKPATTILLDEERELDTAELVESFPVILYQLRHTAHYDYMLPATSKEEHQQRTSRLLSVVGESDFPHESAGPFSSMDRNETEEEFAHRIRAKKAETRDKRINKFVRSDEDIWRSHESDRQFLEIQQQQSKLDTDTLLQDAEERDATLQSKKQSLEARIARSPIPDPIIEMDQTINRDTLKGLEEWSENYEAPPNYWYREKKPPNWRTPKHELEKSVKKKPMSRAAFFQRYPNAQYPLERKSNDSTNATPANEEEKDQGKV